jgi:hypothetical protein
VLIQPMELESPEQQPYYEEFEDSVYNDTTEMNDTSTDTTVDTANTLPR